MLVGGFQLEALKALASLFQIGKAYGSRKGPATNGYLAFPTTAFPSKENTRRMRGRNADEGFGLRFSEATAHILQADPGIDQYRHGLGFEEREGGDKKFQRWLDQKSRTGALADAVSEQAAGYAI